MSAPRLGVARGVVTPSRPGPLAGYTARGGTLATSTIDDLEATVLVLDDGSQRIAWVTLDAVAVPPALAERLATAARGALGCETRVLVAASHTHSGPAHWLGDFAPGHRAPLDEEAVAELAGWVARIAASAREAESGVELAWAETEVVGLAAPRLAPSASAPVAAGVLVARAAGRVVALLIDAPCHPTVLGPDSLGWSADWPGGMRRALRTRFPGAEVAFLNGACGDLSTRFTRREATAAEAERLGALAATAIADAVPGARPLAGRLAAASAVVSLPARAVDLAAATARLDAARREADAHPRDAVARSIADGAAVEVAVAAAVTGPRVDVAVSVVAVDDVRWLATPLEVFSSTAGAVRRDAGTVRVIGCVDGYLGYLPDAGAVAADSYEARTALVAPTAESEFRAAVLPLLTTPSPS